MSLFEDVSTLFAAAITDGQDNEAIVKAAYEDLLGYADADTMNNSAARIDYWVQKLSSGELTTDNFGGSFLEEANTNQGSLISSTTFENNQTVVAAHEDAYEANPDVTLEDLTAVAAENRVEDVAEEDEGVTGETFTLTTSIDDLTGTADDDTFVGDNNTVTAADTVDGGAGNDTLRLVGTDTLPGVSNIETLRKEQDTGTAVAAVDLSSDDLSDVTTLTLDGFKSAAKTITVKTGDTVNLLNGVDDSSKAIDIDGGSADVTAATLGVDGVGVSGATVELEPDAMTELTVNATGDASFIDIEDGAGDLETVTINATADLTIADNGDGISIDSATSITAEGSSSDVNIGGVANDDLTVTLGDGDDSVDMGSSLDSNDTVDGGVGADTLVLDKSGTVLGNNVDNVSNFETLRLAQLDSTSTVDVAKITGLKDIEFVDPNNQTLTVTNLLDGATVTFEGSSTATTTLGLADNTANDSLTISLENATIANLDSGNAFAETLTINSVGGGDNQITAPDGFDARTIEITGDQKLDLDNNALSTSVSTVNAAAATGAVLVKASSTSTEITGGSAGDTLTGQGGADVINGGDGGDTIDGQGGNDTIDAGAGDDAVVLSAGTDTVDGGAGTDTLEITETNNDIFSDGSAAGNVVDISAGTVSASGSDLGQTYTGFENIDASGTTASGDLDLTLTGTSGDNVITGGNGDDVINGGDGADVINGDAGADIIDLGASDGASDTLIIDSNHIGSSSTPIDVVSNFKVGDENGDVIQLSVTGIEGLGTVDDLFDLKGANSISAGDAVDVFDGGASTVDTDNAGTSNILTFSGAGITETAFENNIDESSSANDLKISNFDDGDAIIALSDDGTDSALFLIANDSGGDFDDDNLADEMDVVHLVTLSGVSAAEDVTNSNFEFIA